MRKSLSTSPFCLLILVFGCPDVSDILASATADKGSSSSEEGTTPTVPTTGSSSTENVETTTTSTTTMTDEASATIGTSSTGMDPEPVCGDGIQEGDEKCDPLFCKDMAATDVEEGKKCTKEALEASNCYYDVEKNCSPEKGCLVGCEEAKCGDGQINTPPDMSMEQCDDGSNNAPPYSRTPPDSKCTSGCVKVRYCGDMILDPEEECEPTLTEHCSQDCYAPRFIFVTSKRWKGDLGGGTGLDRADNLCKAAADQSQILPKDASWRAWLADSMGSPDSRFKDVEWNGYYINTCISKDHVAQGWGGIAKEMDPGNDDYLAEKVSCTETGGEAASMDGGNEIKQWSNVNYNGKAVSVMNALNCEDWSSIDSNITGRTGRLGSLSKTWTSDGSQDCDKDHRLYCIQVKSN